MNNNAVCAHCNGTGRTPHFCREMRQARKELGVTLQELGDIIGVGKSQVYRIEAGVYPYKKYEKQIRDYLGISKSDGGDS